jgi:hypothetical protein
MICTLLLVAGFVSVFFFAWNGEIADMVKCLVGFVLGFILTPVIHEMGHIVFAKNAQMECVYVKCFCLRIYRKNGKKKVGFASPFTPDETQVMPKTSGNMSRRAASYAVGGLVFSFILILVAGVSAVLMQMLVAPNYLLWGLLPFIGYSFLLNVAPAEYPGGKTDMAVYAGIKKGCDTEKNMIAAMEIQGGLYEGYSFTEIDESYYFDLPQLPEDEPLFAIIMDLRYRYYLEKNDYDKASDSLNRLAQAEPYLSDGEVQKLIGELTYMHALGGNIEFAEKSAKLCEEYLKQDKVEVKRILAAYAKEVDNTEGVEVLLKQARECMSKEYVKGMRKAEEILCARLEV